VEASRPLIEIIANRRWKRRLEPFPHVIATDLFVPAVAEEIDTAVRKVLEEQPLDSMVNYDAAGWGFGPDLDWPLRLFVSDEWRRFIARVVGTETSAYVSGAVHHHEISGADGRPHTDLTPVYFADVEPTGGVVQPRSDLVNFKSGRALVDGVRVIRTVRAVSILYYTANPPWRPGDGGETGLYRRRSDPVDRPAASFPPINNSMLAFECTPNSFHSFMSNRVSERNSITMWLHHSDTEAVDRWGERAMDRWRESPPPPED
jgi:hypothetical protein